MVILEVVPDSPAGRSDLRKGDILVGLDKWETASIENIQWILGHIAEQSHHDVSRQIRFIIVRDY